MIETSEQWEDIKQDVATDISTQHEKRLVELIEALREVARAAAYASTHPEFDYCLCISQEQQEAGHAGECRDLRKAMFALPDWLLDGKP